MVTTITPTLPMKKWKHREVKELCKSSRRLSWWLRGKESACRCRRRRFDPWVGKIPREGNSNPLQYSCLRNPMDRGAWRATVHGVTKSQTRLGD